MSDTGIVKVGTNSLSFIGGKSTIEIDYRSVKEVSFQKVGSDFINNWITINYESRNTESYGLFSGGRALGWAGSGVTIQMFQALDFVLQQGGFGSVVRRR
jgi:hypothetical protein